jgi:hypothetical protein
MTLGDAVRRLVEAGATPEVIAIAVEEIEAARTGSLNARQARNRRYYQNRKRLNSDGFKTPQDASETVLKASETVLIKTPLARVEDNPSTKKLSGKRDKNSTPTRLNQTPREALLGCLSPEVADGVLAHRQALRKPLTGRAAQLLAKGFAATADPNAAADMMIERGWQGFKPEWFDNERRSNGNGQRQQGQSRRGSISDVAPGFIERIDRLYADAEGRSSGGGSPGGEAVQLLPPQRGK